MTACAGCGLEMVAGEEVLIPNNKKRRAAPTALCQTCAAKIDQMLEAETLHAQLLPAAALGLGAGLVAALVWYGVVAVTQYQLAIVAIGVGWLVARAVRFGSGEKRGGALPWISLGITLLSMVLGQYLIVRHLIIEAFAVDGATGIPLLMPPVLALQLIYESLASDPLTFLFWIIALWQAHSIVRRRRLQPLRNPKAQPAS